MTLTALKTTINGLGRKSKHLRNGLEYIEALSLDPPQLVHFSAAKAAVHDCLQLLDDFILRNAKFLSLDLHTGKPMDYTRSQEPMANGAVGTLEEGRHRQVQEQSPATCRKSRGDMLQSKRKTIFSSTQMCYYNLGSILYQRYPAPTSPNVSAFASSNKEMIGETPRKAALCF